MSGPVADLRQALSFLDACRADKVSAVETGAMRDAHEWVEAAARAVVADDLVTRCYSENRRTLVSSCDRCGGTGRRWNNAAEAETGCGECAFSDLVSDGGLGPRNPIAELNKAP